MQFDDRAKNSNIDDYRDLGDEGIEREGMGIGASSLHRSSVRWKTASITDVQPMLHTSTTLMRQAIHLSLATLPFVRKAGRSNGSHTRLEMSHSLQRRSIPICSCQQTENAVKTPRRPARNATDLAAGRPA